MTESAFAAVCSLGTVPKTNETSDSWGKSILDGVCRKGNGIGNGQELLGFKDKISQNPDIYTQGSIRR